MFMGKDTTDKHSIDLELEARTLFYQVHEECDKILQKGEVINIKQLILSKPHLITNTHVKSLRKIFKDLKNITKYTVKD